MKTLQVFDPAMCCSTGVCGPSVDPTLPRFTADLAWLKTKGVEVRRYNLAQELAAFSENLIVKRALSTTGTKCLPMLLFNGEVVASGGYPTRAELARITDVAYEPGPTFKSKSPELVGISRKS